MFMTPSGRLIILPPNNKGHRDINEDSGDGDELLPKKFNKGQLLASATVDLST